MQATIDQAQAKAEQTRVEATPEYQLEELLHAFQTIEDELFAQLEREALPPSLKGNLNGGGKPFSLLK